MVFKRKIQDELISHLENKQVTVLTGMRRTGKTTLVKELMRMSKIKQKFFYDLERLDNRRLFSLENYEDIILSLSQQGIDFNEKILIVLDEIQLVSNIPSVIKYLYDHYDIKFICTGSSSYYIKNKFQESMAGRKKIFEIHPLDFGEFLEFNQVTFLATEDIFNLKNNISEFERLRAYYETFIEFGGFPEVVLNLPKSDKVDLLKDILNSYINIDIIQLSDIRKTNELDQLIRLLATRIGTKLDFSKLSSASKLSRPTVENYLYFLENTFLIKTIPVYSLNPDREIVKARKIYFRDTGLAGICTPLSGGAMFENTVFNQLSHFGEVSYYQMKNGNEIDFIINKTFSFEVKETGNEPDYNRMMRLSENLNITQGKIISRNIVNKFDGLVWGGMIR
jgi:predicted AAA+ superfamily ATPase